MTQAETATLSHVEQCDPNEDRNFFKLNLARLAVLSKLKYSEFKSYIYLSTLDPFNNQLLALDMPHMLETCAITLSTAYKAMASLHAKGFIVWVHVKTNVQVVPLSSAENFSPTGESILPQENRFYSGRMDSTVGENRTPKPLRSKGSRRSKILDIKNLKKRENEGCLILDKEFLQWVASGVDNLPKPPKGHYREDLIQREAEKAEVQERFLALKARQATVAPLPSFSIEEENKRMQQQQRLETLQFWLEEGEVAKVRAQIQAHPEWLITLTDNGLEVSS